MKTVELYVNRRKDEAVFMAKNIEKSLKKHDYSITSLSPELVIGIGGDGTLLNWLNSRKYSTNSKYIGVNCGTLGFMQDFEVTNPETFVERIPYFVEERLYFVSISIYQKEDVFTFDALNEFKIVNNDDSSLRADIFIENGFLENFVGTGFIFSSPTGSTAQNLASIGPILYQGIDAIIMTPIEAIVNSKFHCLAKSICIPKGIDVTLFPSCSNEIRIIADGKKIFVGNYDQISISYSSNYMMKLTDKTNNFVAKIREKLI